jgi:hypothetical protein
MFISDSERLMAEKSNQKAEIGKNDFGFLLYSALQHS